MIEIFGFLTVAIFDDILRWRNHQCKMWFGISRIYYGFCHFDNIYMAVTQILSTIPWSSAWTSWTSQEFIHSLGFIDFETWDQSAWRLVVDVALSCWQKGVHCFSQAYCPSRTWRKRESSAARNPRPAMGQVMVRALFQEGKEGWWMV